MDFVQRHEFLSFPEERRIRHMVDVAGHPVAGNAVGLFQDMGQGKGVLVLPLGEACLLYTSPSPQDGFAADVKNIVVFHPGDLRLGIFDGKRFRPFCRAEGAHGTQ